MLEHVCAGDYLCFMTFDEYLTGKKIDAVTFHKSDVDLYEAWRSEFDQMHPKSFTAQKLYLINPIRLKYRLRVEETDKPEKGQPKPAPKMGKPIFKKPNS